MILLHEIIRIFFHVTTFLIACVIQFNNFMYESNSRKQTNSKRSARRPLISSVQGNTEKYVFTIHYNSDAMEPEKVLANYLGVRRKLTSAQLGFIKWRWVNICLWALIFIMFQLIKTMSEVGRKASKELHSERFENQFIS